MTRIMCQELRKALKRKPFFNVSGGCGVDTSGGESSCMATNGVWFGFCPFCGRPIKRWYDEVEKHWDWKEGNLLPASKEEA